MAAVTDLIRVILPAWERSLPFHPCFIRSTIEAKVSLLTLIVYDTSVFPVPVVLFVPFSSLFRHMGMRRVWYRRI